MRDFNRIGASLPGASRDGGVRRERDKEGGRRRSAARPERVNDDVAQRASFTPFMRTDVQAASPSRVSPPAKSILTLRCLSSLPTRPWVRGDGGDGTPGIRRRGTVRNTYKHRQRRALPVFSP